MNIKDQICPLCKTVEADRLCRDELRSFFRCRTCDLVFVPPGQFLSAEDEKARYDLHRNFPDDPKYRRFLSRIFIPMQERLAPGSRGLDFGSGPGPTLSVMFEEIGHSMVIYDHFYAKESSALEKQYDFITATEVVEHLHNPGMELDRLWSCLKPGGSLGIMTKLSPDCPPPSAKDCEAFARWHYKNDATHVCFFSKTTFEWLSLKWQAKLVFSGKDAIIFHKKN